ncbi:excitatory amino acid transporter 1-like isoform X2 [Xenia sp. Carnegie-2017]|nr:excitatory amino acid transporter 1-like isoform X2 [Xenia sp. Carnegie-2017]XP_046853643.1 excitatory amino acid transporter 1-like isoform X2 [Xenia sp. Carnegie-2017]
MNSSTTMANKLRNIVVRNLMLILIIVGVISGFILGLSLNSHVQSSAYTVEERKKIVLLTGFFGDIFVRLLKLLIIPLIITSIVLAVASQDTATTGKLGRRTITYYLSTTFIAAIIGVMLVLSIRPGDTAVQHKKSQMKHVDALDSILDMIRNVFPDNLVETTFRTTQTAYKDDVTSIYNTTIPDRNIRGNLENLTKFLENNVYDPWSVNDKSPDVRVIKKNSKKVWAKIEKTDQMNVLGMITCSIVFGIALSKLGPEGQPVKELLEICLKIVFMLINAVMWTSPFGICSLIASKLVEMGDIGKTFQSLVYYITTIIAGVAIQSLIVYPTIYFICVRKNPFRYLFNMQAAVYTALGTSSSAATLPATLKCVKEMNKVDARVAHFVLPIGATVNMDGAAVYEAVACIYIAQLNGYNFGIGKILITLFTSATVSIGASAIPSAGLVVLIMVLEAVGLPTSDVGLLYTVDWFIDRFVTACNITGDAIGCAVIEKLSHKELDENVPLLA